MNTLGLDDDLDSVAVVLDLERTFAFKFVDEEARNCFTVGDIFLVLLSQVGNSDQRPVRCATAMAFYRLRRAFRTEVPNIPVNPATPMCLFNHLPAKALIKKIRQLSGLRLPRARASRTGKVGAYMLLLGVVGFTLSIAIGIFFPSAAAFAAAGSLAAAIGSPILLVVDRGRLPSGYETIGDLTRTAATMNFGLLVKQGARCTEALIWLTLVDVLSRWTTLPKSEIGPDTVLLRKNLTK